MWPIIALLLAAQPTVTDARRRAVSIRSSSRIVTLGGSVTETVHALGRFDSVVGVDKSSLHPPEAASKPGVGYFRAFSAEGVLSLAPTLVLAEEGSGPSAALEQIESAGIALVMLPGERTIAGAKARAVLTAEALDLADRGRDLSNKIDREIQEASVLVARATIKPRVLFIYARSAGTLNVAGKGTGADEIIALAGGVNAISEFSGYRPLTSEGVVSAQPEILLVTDHGLGTLGGERALLALPGVAETAAGKQRRIVIMDDLLLLGFGPRVGDAIRQLFAHLHPEVR